MQYKLYRTIIAGSLALLPALAAYGASSFDFDYRVEGQPLLSQAFDNGSKTFLQMRGTSSVDMVFATDASGERRPIAVKSAAPYVEVEGTYKKIEVVVEGKTVVVEYTGQAKRDFAQPAFIAPPSFERPQQFASVTTVAPPSFSNRPVAVYGTAKPLILNEPTPEATGGTERTAEGIPFVAGRTVLGPQGKRMVKQLAAQAKANGQSLAIAIYRDNGASLDQSRARGRVLRSEFAKNGINNVTWLDGGEKAGDRGLVSMTVAFGGKPIAQPESQKSVASVVTGEYNFEKTLAASYPAPSAPPKVASAVPQNPAVQSDAGTVAKLTDAIKAAKDKLSASVRHLEGLQEQKILSPEEFQSAKKRLETTLATAIAPYETQLAAMQAEAARIEAARIEAANKLTASVQVQSAQPLSIKATPVWLIDESDKSLKGLLEKWAKTAGWSLSWGVGNDFAISAKATLNGSLDQAVNQVLAAIQSSDLPLVATFYEGNKVIKIATKE